MIRYSISQRTKTLWFYAETKSIKLSQQKLKEHFNVARAPRKPTILSLVDKFLTNGSEMLDILILNFPKEGIENVLRSEVLSLMRLCFHIAVMHHLKISILVSKGCLSLTSDKHLHEHFVMIKTIPLIKLLFIYIIKMYCFAV